MFEQRVIAVGVRRKGTDGDPHATAVVAVQLEDGTYHDLGEEMLSSNFSTWWKVADPYEVAAITALVDACDMVSRIPGGIDPRVRAACDIAIKKARNGVASR